MIINILYLLSIFISIIFHNRNKILEFFNINSKNTLSYYLNNFIFNNIFCYLFDYTKELSNFEKYNQDKYIMSRVNYYNKVNNKYKLKKNYIIREIGKHVFTCDIMSTVIKRILRSSYYYDFKNINKYFDKK